MCNKGYNLINKNKYTHREKILDESNTHVHSQGKCSLHTKSQKSWFFFQINSTSKTHSTIKKCSKELPYPSTPISEGNSSKWKKSIIQLPQSNFTEANTSKPKSNFPNKPSNKPISSSTTKILAKIPKTTKLKNHGITQQTRTQTNQPHYKTSKTRQIKPPNPKKKKKKRLKTKKEQNPLYQSIKH